MSPIFIPQRLQPKTGVQRLLPGLSSSQQAGSVRAFNRAFAQSGAPVLMKILLSQLVTAILGALVVATIIQ